MNEKNKNLALRVATAVVLLPIVIFGALTLLGIRDLLQKNHAVLRNYPISAHIRFLLEESRPEMRQYFFESEKDGMPFSFVSCLRVVGCSPLSPIAYCGRVDAEEVRDRIRHNLKAWFNATLERYPDWVCDAVLLLSEWLHRLRSWLFLQSGVVLLLQLLLLCVLYR